MSHALAPYGCVSRPLQHAQPIAAHVRPWTRSASKVAHRLRPTQRPANLAPLAQRMAMVKAGAMPRLEPT